MDSGFVIAVGTAVLLVMAVFIIIFVAYYQQKQAKQQLALKELQEQHRRELMAATFRGQEAERRRLAEDLHDGIGTMLSVTKMSLNQLERQMNGEVTMRTSLHIQKTRSMIDETMTNVRRISRDLVPTTLERFGLLAALEELADRATDGELEVHVDCPESISDLSSPTTLMLYRIAQELVNNAIRHARARYITIQLYCINTEVRMSVLDDGVGFDFDAVMEDKQGGLGLRNIESRLSVMDGHVTFDVAHGRGSQVHVQVRLTNQAPVERAIVG
ncbi:signal transduction histidine kinase [Spirosoma sp. LMG 31448]|uniref:Signal transduction histidine kinase n=2 Tax=Spirosoma utsteinense TaxID=2585773 RepID=A0ABR6W3Q1_9BACT|nr:sensor histidine kinase [Spirosoma utsteinense]MBC3784352.1 signal transduction histidine kinase [Spirosoma utsteinense]MBC3790849.1 signal transduction histidine kinase [Spirosoma utsteinense]